MEYAMHCDAIFVVSFEQQLGIMCHARNNVYQARLRAPFAERKPGVAEPKARGARLEAGAKVQGRKIQPLIRPDRTCSGVSPGEPFLSPSARLISATMRRDNGTCSPRRSAISVMTPWR